MLNQTYHKTISRHSIPSEIDIKITEDNNVKNNNAMPKLSIYTQSTGIECPSESDINYDFEKMTVEQGDQSQLEQRINQYLDNLGLKSVNPDVIQRDYFNNKRLSVFSLKIHSSDCIHSPNNSNQLNKQQEEDNNIIENDNNCLCSPQPTELKEKQQSSGSSSGLNLSIGRSKLYRKRSENLTDKKISQFNIGGGDSTTTNSNVKRNYNRDSNITQNFQFGPVQENLEEELQSVLKAKSRINSMCINPQKKRNKIGDLRQMLIDNQQQAQQQEV